MRPRDNQKVRIYKAEWDMDTMTQTIPNKDLQKWVDDALDRRPIRSRWGRKHCTVELSRGGGSSWGGYIRLGTKARNPLTICHELAHELTPRKYAPHGPEFAGVLLFVVGTVMGADARKQLAAKHKRFKVKSNRAAIPPVRQEVPPPRAVEDRARNRKRAVDRAQQIRRWVRAGEITRADVVRSANGELSRYEREEQAAQKAAAAKRQAEWEATDEGKAWAARLDERLAQQEAADRLREGWG